MDLYGSGVSDLSSIETLVKLKSLKLSTTRENALDIRSIAAIKTLKSLALPDPHYAYEVFGDSLKDYSSELGNIAKISKLQSLEHLDIWRAASLVHDFSFIEDMDGLKELDLSARKDVTSLTITSGLRTLDLELVDISDINFLSKSNSLRELDIRQTKIQNIIFLANTEDLRVLHMSSTPVSDLMPITLCPYLESIRFANTQVIDHKPIEKCRNIEVIDASDTGIKGSLNLDAMRKLVNVNLSRSEISELTIQTTMIHFPMCQPDPIQS